MQKQGLDFFVIGDYGSVHALEPAELIFGKMNDIIGNATTDRDLIDFIFTAGDNLYPQNDTNPTDEEFDIMLSLF